MTDRDDLDDLEELAEHWWGTLDEEERERKRQQFMKKMEIDPDFAEEVHRLLKEV